MQLCIDVSVSLRYHMDASWSETGDRYLLKLFRDYLFHQVNADGMPWIDIAHVVQCLNKVHVSLSLPLPVYVWLSVCRINGLISSQLFVCK